MKSAIVRMCGVSLACQALVGCTMSDTGNASSTPPALDTPSPAMSFFITSVGMGDGANLGGLEGADRHCSALAEAVGVRGKTWRAYLSTTGDGGVNARDRIGAGPWFNARGYIMADDIADLHRWNNLNKTTSLTEKGEFVTGRGDPDNRHDILTGSTPEGMASDDEGDTTCQNWTSNDEGQALVGHSDITEGPTSWASVHKTKGCSAPAMKEWGGDGLFYCFATD